MESLEACKQFTNFLFCAAGDFYTLHHNISGAEFDALHKAFKKYYENALDDFDEMSEWVIGMGGELTPPAVACQTIQYKPLESNSSLTKETALPAASKLMEQIIEGFHILNKGLDQDAACGCVVGWQNYMQGRLEYWGKEFRYFNARRQGSATSVKEIE